MDNQVMTCQDCNRPFTEVIDFLVATPIWNYVMAGQKETLYKIGKGGFGTGIYPRVIGVSGVICLACFDKRAQRAGINYRDSLIVFGIDSWMAYNTVTIPLIFTKKKLIMKYKKRNI